jgi:diguanylate cyclase (GGDEF)-like protein
MRNQVYRDKLTGLYNKTFLEERLPSYLRGGENSLSLLMIKPDNFKRINDTCGHEAGDQAIVTIGVALSRHVPESAVVVRFLGNEMACILFGTDRDKAYQAAVDIRGMLIDLDLSNITGESSFKLSASIGIAVFPDHAQTAPELIAKAHELPLIGRERGGNKIFFPEDK